MTEAAIGVVLAPVAVLGGWLVLGALRTGESVNGYFIDSSRDGNPVLFWFDIAVMTFVTAAGAILSVIALWRGS